MTVDKTIHQMTKIKIAEKNKPVLSEELQAEIEAALQQYTMRGKWREWGMDTLRKNGNMIFLFGPPGTGKTTIAHYMAKRVGTGLATLNMKDIGGQAPGHTERMANQFFQTAKLAGNQTIFMDECEALVWDRSKANGSSMWMVGVINEILMQIVNYSGLIIAATNQNEMVDEAMRSRAFACLQIGLPAIEERMRIWRQKMPTRFPLQLTTSQIERLSDFELSGREIVNAIVREASKALTESRKPTFSSLVRICEKLSAK